MIHLVWYPLSLRFREQTKSSRLSWNPKLTADMGCNLVEFWHINGGASHAKWTPGRQDFRTTRTRLDLVVCVFCLGVVAYVACPGHLRALWMCVCGGKRTSIWLYQDTKWSAEPLQRQKCLSTQLLCVCGCCCVGVAIVSKAK